MPAAARFHDPVAHSHALGGFIAGAVVGIAAAFAAAAVIGAVVGAIALEVGTAGLATPLIVGVAATAVEFGATAYVGTKVTEFAEHTGESLGGQSMGAASGMVAQGSPDVQVNGLAAARAGDAETCDHGVIAQGSNSVLVNGRPFARVGDKISCGGAILSGSPNVFVGGAARTTSPIQSEVPEWVRWAAVIAGIIPALGQAARAIGPALAEVEATGFGRAMQTGVKALGRAMEERGGAGRPARPALVAARRATAQAFYEKQGWPQARIDSHLKGIDFNKPVRVTTIPANKTLGQWQVPGGPKGNYFAPLEETPSRLGISPVGHDPAIGAVSKVQTQYVNPAPVQALSSRAASIEDSWSNPYSTAETQGGGQQYFVPDPGSFQ